MSATSQMDEWSRGYSGPSGDLFHLILRRHLIQLTQASCSQSWNDLGLVLSSESVFSIHNPQQESEWTEHRQTCRLGLGTREVCPLSLLLFALAFKPLACQVRTNSWDTGLNLAICSCAANPRQTTETAGDLQRIWRVPGTQKELVQTDHASD